jgi:hypothetical protein
MSQPLYPQGKKPLVTTEHETRWAPELIWTLWRSENSWPCQLSKFKPSAIQTAASRYTSCAIPTPLNYTLLSKNMAVLYIWDYVNKFHHSTLTGRSWECSVSTETRPWAGQLHLIPVRGRDIALYQCPDWLSNWYKVINQTGHGDDYSTQSIIWRYTSTPSHIFMVWCLIKHTGNFIFTLTFTGHSHLNSSQNCLVSILIIHTWGHIWWHNILTKFSEYLSTGSEFIIFPYKINGVY